MIQKNKNIYIVLTRTTTVLARLIAHVTGDQYTHASIALDQDISVMYSFGRKQRYNPFIGGFCQEYMDQGVLGDCRVLPYALLRIKVTQAQYDKVQTLLQTYIQNADQYHYNYAGLLFARMGKQYKCSQRFYCSEFVYDLLEQCAIIQADQPTAIRPQELMQYGEIVEEGDWKQRESTEMALKSPFFLNIRNTAAVWYN